MSLETLDGTGAQDEQLGFRVEGMDCASCVGKIETALGRIDGKKPWRQKGSGRARAGTIRSPIWRSGGVAFAAKPQDHSQKLNKKMYRAALRSILAELVRLDRLVVVDDFAVDAPKTKTLVSKLDGLGLSDVLIVTDAVDQNLYLAARNLPFVDVRDVQGSDPVSLIAYDKVLVTVSAVKKFEELLA